MVAFLTGNWTLGCSVNGMTLEEDEVGKCERQQGVLGPGVGWGTWKMDAADDQMAVKSKELKDVSGVIDCDCGSPGQQGAGGRGGMEGMNAVVGAVAVVAVDSVGWAEV